jgi:lysozyme
VDLKTQLVEFERIVPHAYRDSEGYWTIGCGRLIDQSKGGGLAPDEIDYLLNNDIRKSSEAVFKALPWAKALNEPRQAVLIGMAFQMGVSGLLGFRATLQAVREERYADAKRGMLASLWAKQTPGRARRLAEQMLTGEWR